MHKYGKRLFLLKRPVPTSPDDSVEETRKLEKATGLRRPWRRVCDERRPTVIFLLKKRNYKVYADLGRNASVMTRHLTVLDTGAGPNVIRRDVLPEGVTVRKLKMTAFRGAKKPIETVGLVDLHVRLGNVRIRQSFIVCERLATPVILGCTFCDQRVEAI